MSLPNDCHYGWKTHSTSRAKPTRGALCVLSTVLVGLLVGCSSDGDGSTAGSGGTNGDPIQEAGNGGAGGSAGVGGSGGVGGGEVGGSGGADFDAGMPPEGGGTPDASMRPDGDIPPADSEFQECVDSLTPVCETVEMDTAEKMEAASCKALEFIEIPLTNGETYGPRTIEGGPYGAKIDWNVGAGTEFVNPVNISEPVCLPVGIDSFQEPAEVTDDLKNTRDIDYSLYTIFRPACMKDGETYPVITWANGTCGLTHGYSPLLSTVASHGYVVIASNSTWTATAPTDTVQTRALDYAEALNEDPENPLYQRLDLDKIGAMGHSQGARATINAASDPRVKSVILWNGGVSNEKPFLNVSADRDTGNRTVQSVEAATNEASQPGAWVWHHQVLETGGTNTGHLVLMEQPERVWKMTVAWWDWQLKGDQEAKSMFIGDDCGLCNREEELEYGHNDLLE